MIRIGCCGFPVSQARYALEFQLVEVQGTFYQVPSLATLGRWRERFPSPFEFILKAWQLITHEMSSPTYRRLREKFSDPQLRRCGAFRPTEEVWAAWERTAAAARALDARVVLFQCPASFTPTAEHVSNFTRFFKSVDRGDLRFVWEPRGAWGDALVRGLCRKLDLVHAVDPFKHGPVAGQFRYFRLHGRSGFRYRYTADDLQHVALLCRESKSSYVLFKNVYMWEDARVFSSCGAVSRTVPEQIRSGLCHSQDKGALQLRARRYGRGANLESLRPQDHPTGCGQSFRTERGKRWPNTSFR